MRESRVRGIERGRGREREGEREYMRLSVKSRKGAILELKGSVEYPMLTDPHLRTCRDTHQYYTHTKEPSCIHTSALQNI